MPELIKPFATHVFNDKDNIIYMISDTNNGVIFWTNFGNVYLYTREKGLSLVVNRFSIGMSFSNQAYSCLRWFDKLLIGQYPAGNLFVLDNKNKAIWPFFPRVPHQKQCLETEREVQSLGMYAGDIYAGVWPWGEVWTFDQNSGWSLAIRPFTSSLSKEFAPYCSMLKTDEFGQRISSFVPIGEDLFLSTSSKTGVFGKKLYKMIPQNAIRQYGCVWRIRKSFNLATQTNMRDFSRFDFVIKNGRVEIWQDNKLLADAKVPYMSLNAFMRSFYQIDIGKGIYGTGKDTFIYSTRFFNYRGSDPARRWQTRR